MAEETVRDVLIRLRVQGEKPRFQSPDLKPIQEAETAATNAAKATNDWAAKTKGVREEIERAGKAVNGFRGLTGERLSAAAGVFEKLGHTSAGLFEVGRGLAFLKAGTEGLSKETLESIARIQGYIDVTRGVGTTAKAAAEGVASWQRAVGAASIVEAAGVTYAAFGTKIKALGENFFSLKTLVRSAQAALIAFAAYASYKLTESIGVAFFSGADKELGRDRDRQTSERNQRDAEDIDRIESLLGRVDINQRLSQFRNGYTQLLPLLQRTAEISEELSGGPVLGGNAFLETFNKIAKIDSVQDLANREFDKKLAVIERTRREIEDVAKAFTANNAGARTDARSFYNTQLEIAKAERSETEATIELKQRVLDLERQRQAIIKSQLVDVKAQTAELKQQIDQIGNRFKSAAERFAELSPAGRLDLNRIAERFQSGQAINDAERDRLRQFLPDTIRDQLTQQGIEQLQGSPILELLQREVTDARQREQAIQQLLEQSPNFQGAIDLQKRKIEENNQAVADLQSLLEGSLKTETVVINILRDLLAKLASDDQALAELETRVKDLRNARARDPARAG